MGRIVIADMLDNFVIHKLTNIGFHKLVIASHTFADSINRTLFAAIAVDHTTHQDHYKLIRVITSTSLYHFIDQELASKRSINQLVMNFLELSRSFIAFGLDHCIADNSTADSFMHIEGPADWTDQLVSQNRPEDYY